MLVQLRGTAAHFTQKHFQRVSGYFLHICKIKVALCREEEMKTVFFNIYNNDEVIIQTQKYKCFQ